MKLDVQAAAIAANRFGLGARPGELAHIAGHPRAWLLDQLSGPARGSNALTALPPSATVLAEVQALLAVRRRARDADAPTARDRRRLGATVRRHYLDQVQARYAQAVTSEQPFRERLVHFWSNHFAISADKQPLAALAGSYENEAIRPNLNGRFADLLLAVLRHPAMLLYLDNARSVGPGSPLARRAKRRRPERRLGLNENLAREVLELHTLGVDGGYGQEDVAELARALTGWSVGGGPGPLRSGKPGTYAFRDAMHEPGPRRVLEGRYRQDGEAQAAAILRDLAAHPATARHLAEKLVRHFVADDPPPALVSRVAAVYLASDGDLPSVHAALVEADSAWRAPASKLKSPSDFLISALRALQQPADDGEKLFASLAAMGQVPWRPGSPAGWPDSAGDWGGPDALYRRIEWAGALAHLADRRRDPLDIGTSVLGPTLSDHTRTAVARAASARQGLTLLLASPDFQRR